jgi:hypothetical protein
MKCITFNNFFFNVANWENGRSWSTKWVIDDPKVFVRPPHGVSVASLYKIKKKPATANRSQQMKRMARPSMNGKRAASSQQMKSRR